jgi:NAD(P)H-nitrite reductase large subunit
MRGAPRHRLRPGGAAVRAGQGLRHAPGAVRHRPLHRQPVSTKLKVTGIDLFSAGDFMGGEGTEEIVLSDPSAASTRSWCSRTTSWSAPCLYGDTVDGSWYFKLLREGRKRGRHPRQADVRRSELGDTGHQGHNKAAAMADSDEVCGCNGVCKGTSARPSRTRACSRWTTCASTPRPALSCGSLHRPGRAAADVHRRRRLQRRAQD